MCTNHLSINQYNMGQDSHPSSSHSLQFSIGEGLWCALQQQSKRTGDSIQHLMRQAIADSLDLDHHTIYQVSTSGALVKGVFKGCVKVNDVLRHGDFGLGTFDGLDGEGIMLNGICWQAKADGSLREASNEALAPFWTTTFFKADRVLTYSNILSWDDLIDRLDHERLSNNIFCAIRVSGRFQNVDYRVACKAKAGEELVQATKHQAEFSCQDLDGTLVGFWTPTYARTINVPGYHLHLLSDDRKHAGHVFNLRAQELTVELHDENELQIVLPETSDFLEKDINGDPAADLEEAEGKHP